ncbi:hypothetical protein [Hyphomonas chukchiensis]|uniref:hypothetical protein n=1 Tax=Hyphomonas chukchiensis TaxID=1280947 RepID=UPI0030FAB155
MENNSDSRRKLFRTHEQEMDKSDNGPEQGDAWDIALAALYRLRRNHELADPNKICDSWRLELAHQSIRCFWNIYRYYMPWVQHLIVGRYLIHENDDLADFVSQNMDSEREDWDYPFEDIGAQFGMNKYRADIDSLTSKVTDFLDDRPEIGLTDSIRRRLFIDMCMTTCADAWWAKDVQDAFQSVEAGSAVGWLMPEPGAHGTPARLRYAKFLAVSKVRFASGQGQRKLDARLDVADAIGVSESTLRHWETLFLRDENAEFELFCTEVAGMYEDELSSHPRSEEQKAVLDAIEPATFKFQETVHMAYYIVQKMNRIDLNEIRQMLRQARERQD